MEKIFLIQANKEGYKEAMNSLSEDGANFEPLGLEYIGAQIQKDYNVKIVQQGAKSNKEILNDLLAYSPDVVGLSVFTYASPNVQKICKKIKDHNPKIITVVGGPHPSGFPQIVKDGNIDFAVIGEGEVTFKELIKTLERKGDVSEVDGIAYWNHGLKITKPRKRIENLDGLAFPLRDKEALSRCDVAQFAQLVYSRGCPRRCSFCDS